MSLARLLICEKTGQWAVALRRELAAWPLRVYETRSFAACQEECAQYRASFVVVEATTANLFKAVEWMARVGREFPQVRLAAVGPRDVEPYADAIREAGAMAVVLSSRQLAPIARMARRHVARASEPNLTFREQVERRLPWKGASA